MYKEFKSAFLNALIYYFNELFIWKSQEQLQIKTNTIVPANSRFF